jgi:hypothetical protein
MANEIATPIPGTLEHTGTVHLKPAPLDLFGSRENFEFAARMAKAFTSSKLVPKHYQGEENTGSAMIAIDLANRMGVSPLMVMQNMAPIEGKPAWSSKFLIAAVNASGKFTPLRFRFEKDEEPQDVEWIDYVWPERGQGTRPVPTPRVAKGIVDERCTAYATDLRTGIELVGPTVSIVMAIQERWYFRNGSKWPTMRQLMLTYRSASFWTGIYAPEQTMGLPTAEDAGDAIDVTPDQVFIGNVDVTPKTNGLDSLSARAREINERVDEGRPSMDEIAAKHAEEPAGDVDQDSGDWPRADEKGTLYDSRGVPHNPGCHSGGKSCKGDGTWRLRKGVAEQTASAMEARYPRVNPATLTRLSTKKPEEPAQAAGKQEGHAETGTTNTSGVEQVFDPGKDGPTYEDVLEWIANAESFDEVDGCLDAARDIELTDAQRADLAEACDKRRSALI